MLMPRKVAHRKHHRGRRRRQRPIPRQHRRQRPARHRQAVAGQEVHEAEAPLLERAAGHERMVGGERSVHTIASVGRLRRAHPGGHPAATAQSGAVYHRAGCGLAWEVIHRGEHGEHREGVSTAARPRRSPKARTLTPALSLGRLRQIERPSSAEGEGTSLRGFNPAAQPIPFSVISVLSVVNRPSPRRAEQTIDLARQVEILLRDAACIVRAERQRRTADSATRPRLRSRRPWRPRNCRT